MGAWYKTKTDKNESVVSSRIRLARNVKGIPFPRRMKEDEKLELLSKIKNLLDSAEISEVGKLKYFNLSDIPSQELLAMVERHIISPDFVRKQGPKGLVISEDETVSIMLLEEDHIRIQVLLGGFELNKAYEIALKVEALLEQGLSLAFDKDFGFLTECPTNLGTGLRASVMLHLPLLEGAGSIPELGSSVSKIGLTVRGMYGEKSQSRAALYQLSNQVTLGLSEEAAIKNLTAITNQIILREQNALKEIDKITLEDTVFRALGTLKYARKLSSEEMMKLISRVKLGVFAGILSLKDNALPITLLIETQPAFLQKTYGIMTPEDRDELRARVIREALS